MFRKQNSIYFYFLQLL